MNARAGDFGQGGRLRLIRDDDEPALPTNTDRRSREARAADIARENRQAARLDDADVRAAFAVEVARSIEGGRAAILRPERRRDLIAAAVGRGLREFDAHLVIAIVQDAARRDEGLRSPPVEGRLAMVPAPTRGTDLWPLAIASALALAILAALIVWTLGA